MCLAQVKLHLTQYIYPKNSKTSIMKTRLIALLLVCTTIGFAQDRKTDVLFGFFPKENRTIYGFSIGLTQPKIEPDGNTTVSNGFRIEPFGKGFSIFFSPRISYPKNLEEFEVKFNNRPTEIINGINISGGTMTFANVNGISISGGLQALRKVNGISLGFGNLNYVSNGIQLGIYGSTCFKMNGIQISSNINYAHTVHGVQIAGFNDAKYLKGLQVGVWNNNNNKSEEFYGLQIGILNKTKKLRGIQLGLWNVNEKRSLPLVNWQFKG